MFEDSLFATNARGTPRRGMATVISFGLQAVILGVLVLVPLIYTDAVPLGRLRDWVEIPVPQGRAPTPPQQEHPASHPIQSNMQDGRLIEPIRIPPNVSRTPDPIDSGSSGPPEDGVYGLPEGIGSPSTLMRNILPSGVHNVAPPSIAPPHVVKLSTGVTEGLLIQKITPPYPPIARQARVQGSVVLQATINRDGTIQHLQVVSGHPMLVPAALDAVRQWRYRPYLLNNEPVEVETQITVNFTLGG